MSERFGGIFGYFFGFFIVFVLGTYLMACYNCIRVPSYCGPDIVHVCSPLPWVFTVMIVVLRFLGKWRHLSLVLVIIGFALTLAWFGMLISTKQFFTIIMPLYFITGIVLASISIAHRIARSISSLSGHITRGGWRGERARSTIQGARLATPMVKPPRPAVARAREQPALAPPQRLIPAPQAVLKWGGVASALNNVVALQHAPPLTSSSISMLIAIERAERGLKLIVENIEYPLEAPTEIALLEALGRCSSMKSTARRDVYYDLMLERGALRDALGRLESAGRVELGCVKTVIKRRVLRPALLKRVATHQFVKYMFPSRIPKKLYMLDYGKAFDKAIKALARTRSLENAKMRFIEEFVSGKIARQYIEQRMVSLEEVRQNAFKGLEAFMRTEFYARYRRSYLIPKPRIILIDDSYAVFAQPDLKSIDNNVIIDVKVFDPNKAGKEEQERVELEMKVFQLAYPGAKAILLGFPYGEEYDTPKSLEPPPLQPSEAFSLLAMLKKFCAEKGSYQAIDLPKYETVCYTINPDGYEFEVYEFEAF